MNRLRFTGLLLQPSFASFWLAVLGSFGILAAGTWSYGLQNGLIYAYLFGPNSSAVLITSSESAVTAFGQAVFGNPLLNKILFFIFWMLIGLVVYGILSGFGTSIGVADKTVRQLHYVHVRREQMYQSIALRITLRAIALSLWFIYMVFFIKLILPFCVLAAHISVGSLNTLSGWLFGLLGFLLLALALHLHVVLLRFTCLRVRVFGGVDDIMAS